MCVYVEIYKKRFVFSKFISRVIIFIELTRVANVSSFRNVTLFLVREHSKCRCSLEYEVHCGIFQGANVPPCVPFGRAHPYALILSKGLPSGVRALKGWRVYRTKQLFLEVPFCVIIRRCRHHAKNQRKGSWGPEVSISCTIRNPSFRRALWSG